MCSSAITADIRPARCPLWDNGIPETGDETPSLSSPRENSIANAVSPTSIPLREPVSGMCGEPVASRAADQVPIPPTPLPLKGAGPWRSDEQASFCGTAGQKAYGRRHMERDEANKPQVIGPALAR